MPNPNPRKEFIVPYQFKPKGEKPMSGRLFVRVTPEIEQVVRSLPDSPEWLRRVICDAVKRELGQPPGSENATPPPQLDSPPFAGAD